MKKQILCCATAILMGWGTMAPLDLSAQAMGNMGNAGGKAAMKSMESPAKVYGDLYKQVSGEIISAAEAMPADKYDFAPTTGNFTGVRTFGGQVDHLISANYGFFTGFGMTPTMTRDQIKALKTKDELVKALKDSFDYTDKAVATITPENAWQSIGENQEATTRAGAATFCLAHANDHYGQMVEYLRMNGIVPPASQK